MNKLCLYTLFFPYGNGEAFLMPELDMLASEFDEIIIFPLHKMEGRRSLPPNVKCEYLFDEVTHIDFNIGHTIKWAAKFMKENGLQNIRYEAANFKRMLAKSYKWLEWFKVHREYKTHYSYWFDEWVTILGLAKQGGAQFRLISRAHGFDLYEDRAGVNGFPYREAQFNAVEKVYPVSKNGENFLKEKYPEHAYKVEHAYLGSRDAGFNSHSTEMFHILSVANLIELKRVSLIVESLKLINKPVHWTHFGDGRLRNQIEKQAVALPENVTYEFKGAVGHQEILDFMGHTPVDIFLSLSSSEGLPVSMMEALSAGIPVVSTNVGGVPEMINDTTGVLLEANPKPIGVARVIERLMMEKTGAQWNRAEIRQYWECHFDGKNNFKQFCKHLKSLALEEIH